MFHDARRRFLELAAEPRRRDLVRATLLFVAYAAAGWLSLNAATEHRAVSSLWPPAGIAIFALYRYGPRLWPGVAAAALVLNASNGISLGGAAVIAAGDVLEAIAGAWLLRRAWGAREVPESVGDIAAFAAYAGAISTMIGATVGVATLVLTSATTWQTSLNLWLVWWTGDAVGVVVVAPLLFAWASRPPDPQPQRRTRIEAAMLLALLAVGCDVVFARWGVLAFAVFPLAGWIALRYGLRGASLATVLVALVAGARTLAGYGPFTIFSPTTNLFALQLFLVLLGVMNLLFAALQAEANASQGRLARLSHLLLTAHEDERRRVAREVHDELGQALTAAKIGLGAALQRTQLRGSLDSERHVRGAVATLDRAIEAVQRIVLQLRPGVLDNLGPLAAIEYAAQQFTAQTHVPVTLALPPEPLPINTEGSTVLYRVTQEALTNIMRHAAATMVLIHLRRDEDVLTLRIVDNGRGIDEEQVRNPRSMGILGMRERAAACDGSLEVRRAPPNGTAVTLTLPADDPLRRTA
ncbi:MAG TPA: MASE1 domain-containing protein [Gemmatimonadaceae bacterium]|jgi:signal transduction histidine kinase